jgi:hypothetical protein
MSGPMNKHQNLAQGHDPYSDQPTGKGTGGLRNNDADSSWDGSSNIHETDPSKDGAHSHGEHGHSHVREHHPSHHRGGHEPVHHHHPEGHHGGHIHHKK